MANLNRRQWLRLGAVGTLGLSLPRLLEAETSARPAPKVKSCVLFVLQGAPSQLDIWDMKPEQPDDIRGPFKPIRTSADGVQIVEHLPRLAKVGHLFSIVRSMTHRMLFHNTASYYTITGCRPLLDLSSTQLLPTENDFPHLGTQVARSARQRAGAVPAAVSLPNAIGEGVVSTPGQNGGFLGPQYAPLTIDGDPNQSTFALDGLSAGGDPNDLAEYPKLLATIQKQRSWLAEHRPVQQMTSYQERALRLLTSEETRRAFELTREPSRVRERYGRHKYGQSLLFARRLVEAGVRLVTIYWGGVINNPLPYWDTHKDLEKRLKNELLPPFDQCFSAFLEDLHARGLLDSTLVICMGEFGRTPRLGQVKVAGDTDQTGRDHWPYCYSLVVAGGGATGGRVLGRSDRTAAYPVDDPYTPEDLGASILHTLGINPSEKVQDGFGRNVPLSAGRVRKELFS